MSHRGGVFKLSNRGGYLSCHTGGGVLRVLRLSRNKCSKENIFSIGNKWYNNFGKQLMNYESCDVNIIASTPCYK